MADHGSTGTHDAGMEEHRATYEGFLKGAIALSIICGYILVSLVAFRFAHVLNVFTGFAGLIVGVAAVGINVRAGSGWTLSVVLLVLFGLITAVNVS
jgi:hypothetical protein